MNRFSAALPARLSLMAVAVALAGCSTIDNFFSGDKVDYRSAAAKSKPLEVPPDLTQLARDSRYAPTGGIVSASSSGAAAPQTAAAGQAVALNTQGAIRVERQGNTRWLVVPAPPEQLWPQIRAFWLDNGFVLSSENADAGLMETDWAENRSKLPNDIIRNTLGKVFSNLFDSGLRDRFRTRLERTPAGTEIYVTHRGAEEVLVGERKESTTWQMRPADPQLEAEYLTKIMVRLGAQEPVAKATVAAAPDAPARARLISTQPSPALEVDEPFDRAWRRVGLALDRSGFTVEDRDRAGGLYYVRYVDPKYAGQEEPGFFAKLFGSSKNTGPVRYRIAVKSTGEKTTVAVLNSNGSSDVGDNGKTIVGLLVNELK